MLTLHRLSRCTLVIVLLFTASDTRPLAAMAQASSAPPPPDSTPQAVSPVAVDEIEPCCPSRRADPHPGPIKGGVEVPRGEFVDPATYRKLKEQAKSDPRVPTGDPVALAEDAPPSDLRLRRQSSTLAGRTGQHDEAIHFAPGARVATGPNNVLDAVDGTLRLSSTANGDLQAQRLDDHFGIHPSVVLGDPQVYFDRASQHFFIVAVSMAASPATSSVYLSVSQGRRVVSLEEGWCHYRIPSERRATSADSPRLGMNEHWMAIGVNDVQFAGGPDDLDLHVFDTRAFVDNASRCPALTRFVFKAPPVPAGRPVWTVHVPARESTPETPPLPRRH